MSELSRGGSEVPDSGTPSGQKTAKTATVRRQVRERPRLGGSLKGVSESSEGLADKTPAELVAEIVRMRAMAELERSSRYALEEIVRSERCIEEVLTDIDRIESIPELFEYMLERLPQKLWPGTKLHFHQMREHLVVESEAFRRNPQINDLGEIFRHALSAYLMSGFENSGMGGKIEDRYKIHPDEFPRSDKDRDYYPITIRDAVIWGAKDRKVDVTIGYVELPRPKPGRERQTDPHEQVRKVVRAFKARLEQVQGILLMEEHKRLACEDPLTGILNRRGFFETVTTLRKQYPASNFSIITLDLDHFKSINDRYGHDAGDDTLKTVSAKIREIVGNRKDVVPARFGGEEFVIYCQSPGNSGAKALAEMLRKAMETISVQTAKERFSVTASFGVSDSRGESERIEEAIARADALLYRAKKDGRNRVATAAPDEIVSWPAHQKSLHSPKTDAENRRTSWVKTLRSLFDGEETP